MSRSLTIGRLAQAAGVKLGTVRYYERSTLMPKPRRSATGYRLYSGKDLERLKFIRGAKSLGFILPKLITACSGHGSVRDGPIIEAVVAAQPTSPPSSRKSK